MFISLSNCLQPSPEKYQTVPNSQLIVSRTVEKRDVNGKTVEKSSYNINNATKTYTEVQTLLKGYGVDLDHKRFLILQGEVESIALMKPKGQNDNDDGLLEYLEDIIGTSTYKSRISEFEVKLEEMAQERDEKLSHLKLIQKETKNLQGQSQEAIEYIEGENQVARLQNKLLQKQIITLELKIQELNNQNV